MNPVWGDDIDLDNVFVTLEDQLVPTVGLSRIVCDLSNAIIAIKIFDFIQCYWYWVWPNICIRDNDDNWFARWVFWIECCNWEFLTVFEFSANLVVIVVGHLCRKQLPPSVLLISNLAIADFIFLCHLPGWFLWIWAYNFESIWPKRIYSVASQKFKLKYFK